MAAVKLGTAPREPFRQADDPCPPPRHGERMTRAEFERRWDAHPEIKCAELIDGVAHVEASVSPAHGEAHAQLIGWAGTFRAFHSTTAQLLDNVTLRVPAGHDVQPDVLLRRRERGGSTLAPDAVEGAPEFVFEVAVTSAALDLGRKRAIYLEASVREYAVWQVPEGIVNWWEAIDGDYRAIEPGADGVIESRVFPGLRLDVPKLLAGDLAGVLAAVTRG